MVVELFQIYKSHTIEIENVVPIRIFASCLKEYATFFNHVHHGPMNPKNPSPSFSGVVDRDFALLGYNGLNMVDFYVFCGRSEEHTSELQSQR